MGEMKSINRVLAAGAIGASLLLGGCASIVHNGDRSVAISTSPPGATASIRKSGGGVEDVVLVNKTPFIATLDPKKSYFKGQSYTLRLELPGYQTTELELTPKLSGWYWGNIVFGGLIGMLAVDPATGAMWNITPDKVEHTLATGRGALIKSDEGFMVVLVSELTPAEREQMVRLN